MKKFRKQDSEKYFEEKKPVRLVDTQEYMEMIRALLEDGQEVSMIVTGNSMRPFLKHGRDKICMKKTDRKLRKGDIVFYRRENGQYVMHRILKCGDQSYTLLGDGQIVPESGIRQEQIFARITKVQVRGKWIGPENFRWRFFEHIWIQFYHNTADTAIQNQADCKTSCHNSKNHARFVHLISGNNINQIFSCNAAEKSKRGTYHSEKCIKKDGPSISDTVMQNPFPVIKNFLKCPIFPFSCCSYYFVMYFLTAFF